MKDSSVLWYSNAAENWDEALPLGNGRIGAMIFGGAVNEKLQLNEDSVWSGTKRERNNRSALESLPEIRRLIADGKIPEAEKLVNSAMSGTPPQQRHYQPLGDLSVDFPQLQPEDYIRSLDLENALYSMSFTADGVRYTREAVASCPDNVIAVRFFADKPGKITFSAYVDGRDDNYDVNAARDDKTLVYEGCTGSAGGVYFACVIRGEAKGGSLRTVGNRIYAESCDEATLYVAARTNFYTPDYKNSAANDAVCAARKGFSAVKAAHIADYAALYGRSSLSLAADGESIPTDERLERIKASDKADPVLSELYWNYAKYLMISGSRPGTQPLNLQGIWNKDMWPAWGSKYTININTEMNYWGAEAVNLPECVEPLFDLIGRMRENGRVTAREMYGCGGFVAHHNTDLWGDTAPQDLWIPATQWPMGAAWLCLHIWEHFNFTGNVDFLRGEYDTMKEAAEFFTDFLIMNKNGELVTCPSISPENTYVLPDGTSGNICSGPTMDTQIIRELFGAVISAAHILNKDGEFAEKLEAMSEKLPKNKVGKYGQIMEWAEDYDEAEPGHRHISQLFGLYPAAQITRRFTPDLAEAADATIARRLSFGGGHTGWSRAWIINMRARLLEGAEVGNNVRLLFINSTNKNVFDSHPPFQIDGNFGGAAGITEALLQSHSGEIRFLPALPPEWSDGTFTGLIARGGFIVSLSWKNAAPVSAEITSQNGNSCRVYSGTPLTLNGSALEGKDGVYSFETERGKSYKLGFIF